MSAYTPTAEQLAAYDVIWDFRTQFVKAARQILATRGIEAVGPGEGVQKIPRYYTSVDFKIGAATGRKTPVALGDRRYSEYSQFYGTLSIFNTVPMETDPKTSTAYLTEDHARELDRLTSVEHTLFMEHFEPFTAELLPLYDVQEIMPIEPDERPEDQREINAAFFRRRILFEIRRSAWPTVS